MKTFFMNTKDSKTNEPHRLKYNLRIQKKLKNLKIQTKIWH